MWNPGIGHGLRWCACVGTCVALLAPGGCNNTSKPNGEGETLSQLQTTGNRIGPAQLTPEQVQSQVDAFTDRFATAFAQACDTSTREHPGARNALHAVKLATVSGAYTIAAGPNPVVSVIDLMVQVTLVRHSISNNLVPRLLGGEGGPLLEVLERYEKQAWSMGERILTEAQRTELRGLIETWIAENPEQVYVAGVRFSDFARLRPSAERPAGSVFSLLRLDPFASLDPTTREIEEARLLSERIFFYAQRMPQLITWRAEQLHYTVMGSREIEGLLADINQFNSTSQNLAQTVENLRTLIPEQTREAIAQLDEAIAQQRAETIEQLESQQQELSKLLDQANLTIDNARAVNMDVQDTLEQADEVGRSLKVASDAVRDAGTAWEGTILAFQNAADSLTAGDGGEGGPSGESVSFTEVVAALEQMQRTAVELRLLLEDINTTAESEELGRNVTASVDQTRRGMEELVNHVTVRIILIIIAVFVAAVAYRLISTRVRRGSDMQMPPD